MSRSGLEFEREFRGIGHIRLHEAGKCCAAVEPPFCQFPIADSIPGRSGSLFARAFRKIKLASPRISA